MIMTIILFSNINQNIVRNGQNVGGNLLFWTKKGGTFCGVRHGKSSEHTAYQFENILEGNVY